MTLLPGMSAFQRLKTRPWEHAIAVVLLLTSAITFFTTGGIIAAHLHGIVEYAWVAVNLVGGVLVLLGLHWRGSPIIARAVEQVGWFTEATTLTVLCLALIYFGGWAMLPGLIDEFIYVGAMILRGWFLHDEKRAERAVFDRLREQRRRDGDA